MTDQDLPDTDNPPPPVGDDVAPAGAAAPRPVRKKAAKKRPPRPDDDNPTPPPTRRAPPPVDEAGATRRGIIVIAVTVLIGVLIFAKGVQHQDAVNTAASNPSAAPTTLEKSKDEAPTTTQPSQGTTVPKTPITAVAPADLKVVVANAVDPSQTIAGPMGQTLTTAGYEVTGKVDISPSRGTSSVYYSGDQRAEALAVAKVVGFSDSSVAKMPDTPPTALNGADILVVVGKDHG